MSVGALSPTDLFLATSQGTHYSAHFHDVAVVLIALVASHVGALHCKSAIKPTFLAAFVRCGADLQRNELTDSALPPFFVMCFPRERV